VIGTQHSGLFPLAVEESPWLANVASSNPISEGISRMILRLRTPNTHLYALTPPSSTSLMHLVELCRRRWEWVRPVKGTLLSD